MYVIIDIETTGGNRRNGRITEIAAFLHDGGKVVDKFVSLINPEQPIDSYVSRLTGITDDLVADAPLFADIADDLDAFTANATFVAHNVNFDYPFVREEFRRLGKNYSRRRLCTVRLARQAFPDLPSYSLNKITHQLSIELNGHHRAESDAFATVKLFEKIVEKHSAVGLFDFQFGVKELARIGSPLIDEAVLNSIPDDAGVYRFYDRDDRLLLVKGAAHLLTEVTDRLGRNDSANDRALLAALHRIDWDETGSTVLAKIIEADTVLTHDPEYNRGRIGANARFGLYADIGDDKAVLTVKKHRKNGDALMVFPSFYEALHFVEQKAEKLGLRVVKSSDKRVPPSLEAPVEMLDRIIPSDSFLVVDEGRQPDERSLIAVDEGGVAGYSHRDAANLEFVDVQDMDHPLSGRPELRMILAKFIAKNRYDRIISVPRSRE